jgi:hypothetical protein
MTGDMSIAFRDADLVLHSDSPAMAGSKEHILRFAREETMCFLQRQQDRRMRLMKV